MSQPTVVSRTTSVAIVLVMALSALAALAIWKGADAEKILLTVGTVLGTLVGVRTGGALALADPREGER